MPFIRAAHHLKNNDVRELLMKWIFLIVIVVLQAKLWVGHNGLVDLYHRDQAISKQQLENQKLQAQLDRYQKNVALLRAYPQALEQYARRDLGRLKKDEKWYWIIDDER